MYSALGFDLDNTLFDQSQHLRSFYRQAGIWISKRSGVAAAVAEQSFVRTWERRTMASPFVFDEALERLGLLRPDWVRELVAQYRAHRCPLTLYDGVRGLLERLRRRYPLFLITDGYGELQRYKVERLGLRPLFDAVVFTADYGLGWEKPSVYPFIRAALLLGVRAEQCLFVGDDPERDIDGARRARMAAARVLTGPYRNYPCQPPYTVLQEVAELETELGGARAATA